MKTLNIFIVLSCINLILLLSLLFKAAPAEAQPELSVLKGSGLELVDKSGTVRARFDIYDDGNAVLRIIDKNGTLRVKLGADEKGSGLLLANYATEPGVHILANEAGSSIKIRNKDGKEEIISPGK